MIAMLLHSLRVDLLTKPSNHVPYVVVCSAVLARREVSAAAGKTAATAQLT
jgi:hypothetical protein